MKKTLLAAALLAATSYATAASNVTLYGVLDAGVTVSKQVKNALRQIVDRCK